MTLSRFSPLLALLAVAAGCGGGPAPDDAVRVPDVRGMNSVDAAHSLAAAGLRWRRGDGAPESRPPGWVRADDEPAPVTGQRPAPGEEVDPGAVVSLAEAPPFGAKAIRKERAFPTGILRVGPTSDPRVVRVLVPPTGCFQVHSKRALMAGEVALVDILLRSPGRRRGCVPPPHVDGHWVRVRFDAPANEKAVVSRPIERPRPTEDADPAGWSRPRIVSADGRTLAVDFVSGAPHCNSLAGVEAFETRTSVRIELRAGRPAGAARDRLCFSYAIGRTALVRLREPLGDRSIVRSPKPRAIPDVRGMQSYEAQHLLASLGLRWREGGGAPQSRPAGHDEARELIVHQEPKHGRHVLPGTVVALARRSWLPARGDVFVPAELFRSVRATDDPNEVEVAVRMSECLDVELGGAWRAGEVLLVRVDGRHRATCSGSSSVTHRLRARFDQPVGARAVLPLPVTRPRPSVAIRAQRWEEARVVSTDGRTVAVRWTGGVPQCFAFARLQAEEGPRTVRLTLRTGRPKGRDPSRGCIYLGLFKTAVVRLREPLGSRRLVDGARR